MLCKESLPIIKCKIEGSEMKTIQLHNQLDTAQLPIIQVLSAGSNQKVKHDLS